MTSKKIGSKTLLILVAIFYCGNLFAQHDYTKPPLGWNSWDSYGKYPTEKAMLANIDAMVIKLVPFGYNYFVIDAGWNIEKDKTGQITHTAIDKFGRYTFAKTAFPGGIKAIADKAHEKGLKFGIHIMRGIPRYAYRENLPILNSKYTARDIADTTSLCVWNDENYGVNMTKPGAQEYYDSYITQLANWGVDFIKADDITGFPLEVEAVKNAIKKTGRDIMLSLSPGEGADVKNVAAYNEGQLLRITKDVWDNQRSFGMAFTAWKKWAEVSGRKFWLDMDMIPFGRLCLHNPNPNFMNVDPAEGLKNIKGLERMSTLSTNQKYTFITLRALSASPLFMGGDLPTSDPFSFELLTNKDMLACNQNGITGKLIYEKDGLEIWKTEKKGDPKQGWIGIFNRNITTDKSATLSMQSLGFSNQIPSLYSVWDNKDLAKRSSQQMTIPANGVKFLKYKL